MPKGFFPQQDTGRLTATFWPTQDISFQSMRDKLAEVVSTIVKDDPAVAAVIGFTGGGGGGGERHQHRRACSSR